jgi:hypothetical protein
MLTHKRYRIPSLCSRSKIIHSIDIQYINIRLCHSILFYSILFYYFYKIYWQFFSTGPVNTHSHWKTLKTLNPLFLDFFYPLLPGNSRDGEEPVRDCEQTIIHFSKSRICYNILIIKPFIKFHKYSELLYLVIPKVISKENPIIINFYHICFYWKNTYK